MPMIVRAFPILPGNEDRLRAFAAAVQGPRSGEADAFYRSFGVVRESWHVQRTPHGTWIIGVTEVRDDPQAVGAEYARSQRPFDRWFKDQVRELSGIDPDTEPLGPPTESIFEWKAES